MANCEFEKHCWAEIDLDALRNNFSVIRNRVGATPICAVVKADAYGHGDLMVARVLAEEGAAWFAVSCLSEALHLRRGGIEQPIIILGYTDPAYAKTLAENHIVQTVFSTEYARTLASCAVDAGVEVEGHLKADTGMGRLGFDERSSFDEAVFQMQSCFVLPGLRITGLFQHFAVADSGKAESKAFTEQQHTLFMRAAAALRTAGHPLKTVHCCNSAGQMIHPEWGMDMVRAGIILYGCDPSGEVHFEGLKPVMTLKTVVSYVKELKAGETVSYGRTFRAPKSMKVATVCVGYADGYPRLLSGKGVMSIHNWSAPVVGRVCMDQCMLDLSGVPNVKRGDEVTVFGIGTAADSADDVAAKCGSINYEVLCSVSRRVPRVYKQNGKIVSVLNYLDNE